MAQGRPFTEKERALAKEMLEQGHSFYFIGGALGRDQSVVRRWAIRTGLVAKVQRIPWSDEDLAKAVEMRARGTGMKRIAQVLNRSDRSIAWMLSVLKGDIERQKSLLARAAPQAPPAPPEPRDIFVAWMVAQEKVRRRVDRSVNTA